MNSNPTNDNMKSSDEDDNGNRAASVADLRKKFDERHSKVTRAAPIQLDTPSKISENKFKQEDAKGVCKPFNKKIKMNGDLNGSVKASGRQSKKLPDDQTSCQNSKLDAAVSKLDVVNDSTSVIKNDIRGLGGGDCSEIKKSTSRVNDFASYIPSKDFQKSESIKNGGDVLTNGDTNVGEDFTTDLVNGTRFSVSQFSFFLHYYLVFCN